MAYPASIDALVTVHQDSDGAQPAEAYTVASPYTYTLGSAAKPPLTTGWQLVPKGAFALPAPPAPVSATAITSVGHNLVPSSTYRYALCDVTRNGSTTPSATLSVATGASAPGSTGTLITLPAVTASISNPVEQRYLYRTRAGGATLYVASIITDLAVLVLSDGRSDDDLQASAPASNGSGLLSPVSVTYNGTALVEKAPGSTLSGLDYIVDYGYSATGGTITFASVDVGKALLITYTASVLMQKALFNTVISALKDTRTVLGQDPQGSAADLTTRLTTTGRQIIAQVTTTTGQASVTFVNIPQTFNHLWCVVNCRATGGTAVELLGEVNGNTSANYQIQTLQITNTSVVAANGWSATLFYAGEVGGSAPALSTIHIVDYATTPIAPNIFVQAALHADATSYIVNTIAICQPAVMPVSSLTLIPNGTTFLGGDTLILYGEI